MPPSTPRASHRARKKRQDGLIAGSGNSELIITHPVTKNQKPAFPLVAFLLPTKAIVSQWAVLSLILMAVGLFRWSTGFWGYSGMAY